MRSNGEYNAPKIDNLMFIWCGNPEDKVMVLGGLTANIVLPFLIIPKTVNIEFYIEHIMKL